MGLYERFILPRLVHFACGLKPNTRQRWKVVPDVKGRVLELGFGSGLNLPFYDDGQVEHVWALEPSEQLWNLARKPAAAAPFRVEHVQASAEEIPLDDGSVDSVLVTYTLCTIPGLDAALAEVRRVLKPGGFLAFCEHGAAPDERVLRWQNRLNPIWKRFSGGCNLNRPIPELLERGGFRLREVSTMYLPGWRPATFNYWGTAVPA